MMHALIPPLAATLLALSHAVVAPPRLTADPPAVFVLEPGSYEPAQLIDLTAAFLQQTHLYSLADLQNNGDSTITLQTQVEVPGSHCLRVVAGLLYTKGFGLVERDPELGIYEWVSIVGPKRTEFMAQARSITVDQVLAQRYLPTCVRVLVPLQHVNANAVTNQLRPLFSMGGGSAASITIGSAAGGIVLQGVASMVANAVEVVRGADTPPPRSEGEVHVGDTRHLDFDRRLRALEEARGSAK